MILKDTILSAFTDRLTLMKWLKKVEQALKESVLVDIQVNQTDAQHMTMTFVFEDGAQIATPVITLPKGEQGPQGPKGEQGPQGPKGDPGESGGTQLYLHHITGGNDHAFMYIITTGMDAITTAEDLDLLYAFSFSDHGLPLQGIMVNVDGTVPDAFGPILTTTSLGVEATVYYINDAGTQQQVTLDTNNYPFTDTVTPL